MTERKSLESERATKLADLSDGELLNYCGDDARKWAEAFCQIKQKQGWSVSDIDESLMLGWFANAIEHSSDVRGRLAAQDQKPVALAHVRLEDDGLFADLEVLDGTNLQPSMSPVALYLSPPPAAGWNENQLQSIIERALLEDDDFCTRAAYQNIRQIIARASAKAIVEAILHNAPPDSGAKLIDPIDSRGLKGARKQAAENCASMLPDHGGADAGVESDAWQYECEFGDGWARHVTFHKPQGNKFQRNIKPLYLSKSAPAAANASAVATYKLGRWLSAALEDPNVCAEMKADIDAWIDAGQPNVQPSANASAEPALNWQLSDDAKARIAEIDDNRRSAALNASNIVAGSSNASAVLQNDLAEMLRALGMSDAAQPKSPHEVFQSAIAEMKRQLTNASAENYRDAIDEALVTRFIGVAKGDAKAELNQIVEWDVAVALDPRVSSSAQALIDSGRNASAEARFIRLFKSIERAAQNDFLTERERLAAVRAFAVEALSAHPHASDCDKQGERK